MKDISKLSVDLSRLGPLIKENLVKANEKTAETIWEEVVNNAPVDTGTYVSSIKVYPTEVKGNTISTFIGSDLTVDTKEGASYNLGFLLETGTDPHAIPNAFNWGEIYGYESEQYKRTLDPNWHPGTVARPHYKPALEKAETIYLQNIGQAIKEADK